VNLAFIPIFKPYTLKLYFKTVHWHWLYMCRICVLLWLFVNAWSLSGTKCCENFVSWMKTCCCLLLVLLRSPWFSLYIQTRMMINDSIIIILLLHFNSVIDFEVLICDIVHSVGKFSRKAAWGYCKFVNNRWFIINQV
jgi:hypothetical protein